MWKLKSASYRNKQKRRHWPKAELRENPTNKFSVRLEDLGFKDYDAYLRSDLWKRVREEYAASDLPKTCANCGSPKYTLHHKSYHRLGSELLMDFVPLCFRCHGLVHLAIKGKGFGKKYPYMALDAIGEISRDEAIKRTGDCTLDGQRWVPKGLGDLYLMERKLGLEATRMQYRRIVGGEYPDLFSLNAQEIKKYCATLKNGRSWRRKRCG